VFAPWTHASAHAGSSSASGRLTLNSPGMATRALLLRLLLAFALVFNGTGTAVASAAMELAHADVQPHLQAPAAPPSDSQAPCHGGNADSAQVAANDGAPADSNCCDPDRCDCTGVQSPSLFVLDVRLPPSGPPRIVSTPALRIDHVPPILAGLIRPPIG